MFLIRPRLGHVGWLSFSHTAEVIAEGYRAACEALTQLPECLAATGGVFPRAAVSAGGRSRPVHGLRVLRRDRARRRWRWTRAARRIRRQEIVDWCSADGDFVRHCPTEAISASRLTPASEQPVPQKEVA